VIKSNIFIDFLLGHDAVAALNASVEEWTAFEAVQTPQTTEPPPKVVEVGAKRSAAPQDAPVTSDYGRLGLLCTKFVFQYS